MSKIKFYECLDCGRKVDEKTVRAENWEFGVDLDAVEADADGGVRGHCGCEAKKVA